MVDFHRMTAAADARLALTLVEETGWQLPAVVTTAIQRLERVESLKPENADRETLVAAYLADKASRPKIDAEAARVAAHHQDLDAWTEARARAALSIVATLRTTGADLIEHMRPEAEQCIADITWFATNGRPDIAALVRAGRGKDAERAARVDLAHERLARLQKARAHVTPESFPWFKLDFANDVEWPQGKGHLQGLDRLAAGVERGGDLWWPSWDEALERRAEIDAAERESARAFEQQKRDAMSQAR